MKQKKNLLKSINYNPNFADCWFLLGNLYEMKNDEVEMRKCFSIAVKLAPEQEIFVQKMKKIALIPSKPIQNTQN